MAAKSTISFLATTEIKFSKSELLSINFCLSKTQVLSDDARKNSDSPVSRSIKTKKMTEINLETDVHLLKK